MQKKFIISSIIAVIALSTPVLTFAKDKETAAGATVAEKPAADASAKPVPYRGKVSSVDATAKTFTIKGKERDRVFSITDHTKITREGAAADLAAVAAGEEVRGQATKSGDNWEAVSVMIGAKPATDKNAANAKSEDAKAEAPKAKP